MNCPTCNTSARIANSRFESAVGSTDIYSVMLMVCVNPDCKDHETNLQTPSRIIETIRNKVN